MVNAERSSRTPKIRCRQIGEDDVEAIAELLTAGFPSRSIVYWRRALDRLARREAPAGLPRFGYMLDDRGMAVGVLLLIFSERTGSSPRLLCNLSSWYVMPAFRAQAGLLVSRALETRQATFVNISPAPHTIAIIEAQGFRLYSGGQFVAVPALAPAPADDVKIVRAADAVEEDGLDPNEARLLADHAAYGCTSLLCRAGGRTYPFVFLPRLVKNIIPAAQLVYCRAPEDFSRLARPLGLYLAARGRPFVILDANAAPAGLSGRYMAGKHSRYYRGAEPPVAGDLAYTELVMFGV